MEKSNDTAQQDQGNQASKEDGQGEERKTHQSPQEGVISHQKESCKVEIGEGGAKPQMVESKPQESTESLVQQLVEMGFREDLAKRALEQTKDLEEAANLILIFQDNDEGKIAAPTKAQVRELYYKMVV